VYKLLKDNLGQQGSGGKAQSRRCRLEQDCCPDLSRDETGVSKAICCHASEVKSEGVKNWPRGL